MVSKPPGSATRGPESVGSVLSGVLAQIAPVPLPVLEALFSQWEQIVGADAAPHCRPSLDGPRLVVETVDNVWASEMKWRTGEILDAVKKHCGPGSPALMTVRIVPPCRS